MHDEDGAGLTTAMAQLRSWVAGQATPVSLDPAGPLVRLPETLSRAEVVGVASAVRSARELVAATHVLLRALVERAGFRAVAIEGAEETGASLDRFVRTGEGDPAALLGASQSFLRVHEALAVIRWLRSWTVTHPDDPVSVVHDLAPATPPRDLAEIEQDLARRDLTWHADVGQRIVHWGGTAHLIVGDPRTVPPAHTQRSAGAVLRSRLGPGYRVVALTVGTGTAPFPVPPPAVDFVESAFADVRHDTVLLELPTAGAAPPVVADWLRAPLRTRMVGPVYDAARDRDSRVDAGPLADCIDVLVHTRRITPTTLLGAPWPAGR